MAAKKETKTPKSATSSRSNEEKEMNKHPFESMSQVQNRYGKGRRQSGSDGGHQNGRGSNH